MKIKAKFLMLFDIRENVYSIRKEKIIDSLDSELKDIKIELESGIINFFWEHEKVVGMIFLRACLTK